MENLTFSLTENNDKALSTSGSACLDFFTRITRNADMSDYLDSFCKAWQEDKEMAFQILMNMRDVRTGKGEKLIPQVILVHLKFNLAPNVYEDVLRKMVEYGYWKDLLKVLEIYLRTNLLSNKKYKLTLCPIELQLFAEQLKIDSQILTDAEQTGDTKKAAISLCAKWSPSEGTHFNHHPMLFAQAIYKEMGLSAKEYRLCVGKLRRHLNVLESLMSSQRFDEIDFSKLPSVAMMKMKKAFMRDSNSDGKESDARKKLHLSYSKYLEDLTKGKTKVNIKGIQPHELVDTYLSGSSDIDLLVEAQWSALKMRVKESGAFRDVTAVVDVSSSMNGQPMQVAISLGILVAECTDGPYHGQVITFHQNPSWHKLAGNNLKEQVDCMSAAPWGGSTNMRGVFDLILSQAQNANLTQNEMVKTLFVFTDMQFNGGVTQNFESTFEYAKNNFESAGYKLPRIVCWNLRTSTAKTMPVQKEEEGYVMLSGFSAELLKCILTAKEFTPMAMLRHVLEPYLVPSSVKNCTTALVAPLSIDNLKQGVKNSELKKAFKSVKEKTTTTTNVSCESCHNSDSDSD